MLNLLRFSLLLSLSLLQACQYHAGMKSSQSIQSQKKQSNAATYNVQLGMAYLRQGDMPRAKRKLLTALDLAPDSADANATMAYYFEQTGDTKEAQIYYNRALSLAPKSGAQLNNYGTFLCRLGKYPEAEGYFLKAVDDIYYINTAGAYENAGLCAAAIPDYPKAKKYFLKALKQDPRRSQSLYELVTLELNQSHPKTALMYLQKYSMLSQDEPRLLALAVKAAHQAGKKKLVSDYKARLDKLNKFTDHTGAKNEHNSYSG
ncbi:MULTISPECIES: type IV pilus biogenesis/stability protein PilW [unclassified Legionella]|uniref:type IV pilus biogenesis/stability protein PilW n=1 Tax=unclassified Legionella TaxID=2622702 RepID=UPI001054B1E4|nr:type IV pilus biogenesis/stability protein PilW [Legionella sp. W10-070]MDI9818893.1 type IV pilus biogenesis/stability protein PilW [Legionella sp. PL877]